LISSWTAGTVMMALHLGQGPFLPANLSLTVKRAWQEEQTTAIGIEWLVNGGRLFRENRSFAQPFGKSSGRRAGPRVLRGDVVLPGRFG
jgi:hypothetical protein